MLQKKTPVKRAPQGVLSRKPVYMRLMPDERRALDELSETLNRSTSSVARLLYLKGVEQYCANVNGANAHVHATHVAGN